MKKATPTCGQQRHALVLPDPKLVAQIGNRNSTRSAPSPRYLMFRSVPFGDGSRAASWSPIGLEASSASPRSNLRISSPGTELLSPSGWQQMSRFVNALLPLGKTIRGYKFHRGVGPATRLRDMRRRPPVRAAPSVSGRHPKTFTGADIRQGKAPFGFG